MLIVGATREYSSSSFDKSIGKSLPRAWSPECTFSCTVAALAGIVPRQKGNRLADSLTIQRERRPFRVSRGSACSSLGNASGKKEEKRNPLAARSRTARGWFSSSKVTRVCWMFIEERGRTLARKNLQTRLMSFPQRLSTRLSRLERAPRQRLYIPADITITVP